MANHNEEGAPPEFVRRAAGPRKRTPEQEKQAAILATMNDEDIDTSDIPEIAEEQWANSELFRPKKVFTSFRCDADVVEWLKSKGRGYNTRMNKILRAAMLDEKKKAN